MPYDVGYCTDLYITRQRPAVSAPSGVSWEAIAGQQITEVHRYDSDDGTYLVSVRNAADSFWIDESWIERLQGPDQLRRAWHDEQMTEYQRQMAYAAAFQRLMWREMLNGGKKRQLGDRVTVRGQARGIEHSFPEAWHAEWYAACWGREGIVIDETREFGVTGELYRAYKLRIEFPPDSHMKRAELWWLAEDLEG